MKALSILFIILFSILNYNISIAEEKTERYDNWTILKHNVDKEGFIVISAIGHSEDHELSIVYNCFSDFQSKFKHSDLEFLLKEEMPISESSIATIEYETDIDSGNFRVINMPTYLHRNRIPIDNLHFWEVLNKSKDITLSIKINDSPSKKLVFNIRNIKVDLRSFQKVKKLSNSKCGFNE